MFDEKDNIDFRGILEGAQEEVPASVWEGVSAGPAACYYNFHHQSLSFGGSGALRIRAFFSASCSSLRSCAFFSTASSS